MSMMSDYLESQIIKHLFRTGSYTKPSTIYIALCTTTPTDASTGSTIAEVSGGSYARVQVGPSDATWAAPGVDGLTENVAAINFAVATAGWGTVVAFAICDAATAGNVLLYGTLSIPITVNNGDTFRFAAGAIDVILA